MKPVRRTGWASVFVAMLLMHSSAVTAQTTIDPRIAEFVPSVDHSSPLVEAYQIEFYLQGAAQPFQSASLGKPAPDSDGRIRVDLSTIFLGWPQPGTVYTSTVAAHGPGGATRSVHSNGFSFSVPCSYTVAPILLNVPPTAGSSSTSVTTAGGCSWTATSSASWLTITNGASGSGSGAVTFAIAANSSTAARTGTLTVAGQTVAVAQQGTASPNQPPVLTQPANQTSVEGATVSLALVASDPDGTPLTYGVTGLPATLIVDPATGVISGTLSFTSAGTHTVTATASDGALANSKTFAWTVTDVDPGNLPAPWTSQDVSAQVTGHATYAAGTFSVLAAGADIWGRSDQFRFVYQTLTGDGEIIARVGSLQNTDQWAKAGVMVREDLAADAPNVIAQVTPTQGPAFQWRATRGHDSANVSGFAGAAPQWVRLVRAGQTFSGYYSASGTTWTLMGTSTVAMAAQVYVGLAVTSHNAIVPTTATFTNVSLSGGVGPCMFSVSPTTVTAAATGSIQTATVTSPVGCDWIAASNATWLTITNGASGNGDGTVTFSIAANSDPAARSGTLTIAGQTVTVTQPAPGAAEPPPPPGNLRIRH